MQSPRCPVPACPVRYRGGPDRLCPAHQHEQDRDTSAPELMEGPAVRRAVNLLTPDGDAA